MPMAVCVRDIACAELRTQLLNDHFYLSDIDGSNGWIDH
jgi:hypothetical protein